MSTSRRVDRVWIGSWRHSPEELSRVEDALSLIKQHSPLDYARVIRELKRIWVFLSFHSSLAEYKHSLKACVLDERFVPDSATTVGRLAATIVHEATHARLERCGIEYKQELRTRIEAICGRRELAFAARLPNSAELQQAIAQSLRWYQANPGHFSDAHFREKYVVDWIETARYAEVPDWLIQAKVIEKSIFDRARRLFPIAGWAISVLHMIVLGLTLIVFILTCAFAPFLHPKAYSKSKPPE